MQVTFSADIVCGAGSGDCRHFMRTGNAATSIRGASSLSRQFSHTPICVGCCKKSVQGKFSKRTVGDKMSSTWHLEQVFKCSTLFGQQSKNMKLQVTDLQRARVFQIPRRNSENPRIAAKSIQQKSVFKSPQIAQKITTNQLSNHEADLRSSGGHLGCRLDW